ncbi:MAG: 50S ribosomal protein L2 [Mycoplasmataceae bacterium]|nr:50S ribosomal protein L2 [Mycoplasmataceae bacterium]
MAIKSVKTRSKGRRTIIFVDYKKHLTTDTPEKSLIKKIHNQSGRNNRGVITTRHQGGRQARQYRLVDFLRTNPNPAVVKTIEYDPNRTAFICLITYKTGEKAYILAPQGIKVGDTIIAGDKVDIKVGNAMLIKNVPEGTFVHNIELSPKKGAQLVRSAGNAAQVLGKDETGNFMIVKLPSGETRKIPNDCKVTIGMVSNENHNLINLGKAGRSRHLGIRPTVRGSAMNPNDHPHGGGEGRQPVGYDAPRTPWGKRHMGVKTRKHKQPSTALIIRRRNDK